MGPTKPLEGNTITEKLLSWAANQGPATMLLFLLAAMVAWGGYYAITTAIPQHLSEIKAGYRDVASQHNETVERIASGWERERQVLHAERSQLWEALLKDRGVSLVPGDRPPLGAFPANPDAVQAIP